MSEHPHIVDGEFQSDKYPICPPGKVPLSVKDPAAQDLLWEYAQRRRTVDPEFADDLEHALRSKGYVPKPAAIKTPEPEIVAEGFWPRQNRHFRVVRTSTTHADAIACLVLEVMCGHDSLGVRSWREYKGDDVELILFGALYGALRKS